MLSVLVKAEFLGDKIEGQKNHDSIKNANNNFTKIPTQQILTNSHKFSQQG